MITQKQYLYEHLEERQKEPAKVILIQEKTEVNLETPPKPVYGQNINMPREPQRYIKARKHDFF